MRITRISPFIATHSFIHPLSPVCLAAAHRRHASSHHSSAPSTVVHSDDPSAPPRPTSQSMGTSIVTPSPISEQKAAREAGEPIPDCIQLYPHTKAEGEELEKRKQAASDHEQKQKKKVLKNRIPNEKQSKRLNVKKHQKKQKKIKKKILEMKHTKKQLKQNVKLN